MVFKKYVIVVSLLLSGCVGQEHYLAESKVTFQATDGSIRLLKQLTDEVQETSGLAYTDKLLWTINDSGDDAYLYALNKHHELTQKVRLAEAENIDWEDLAQDKQFLYVADCGNNRGYRNRLQIYKVAWQQLSAPTKASVTAEKMEFSYQEKLPTDTGKNHNFDCEAITVVGDQLWLFTKNRGDQKTNLYQLDKNEPQQIIKARYGFDVDGLITAADYHPELKTLVLLGYGKHVLFGQSFIWLIPVTDDAIPAPVWEQATYQQLSPYAQWEAVSWDRRSPQPRLILTTERSPLLDVSIGELYVELPNRFADK